MIRKTIKYLLYDKEYVYLQCQKDKEIRIIKN